MQEAIKNNENGKRYANIGLTTNYYYYDVLLNLKQKNLNMTTIAHISKGGKWYISVAQEVGKSTE